MDDVWNDDEEDEEELFETLQEVETAVTKAEGQRTFRMVAIRNAYGAARLGNNVRRFLSDELAKMGIKHYPRTLPDNQNALVRLYKAGSPAGRYIEAVLKPGFADDNVIREVVNSDAREVLDQIKALVGGDE